MVLIVRIAQLFDGAKVLLSFALISMFTNITRKLFFFCFHLLHLHLHLRRRLFSSSGVWGPRPAEYQYFKIAMLLQY